MKILYLVHQFYPESSAGTEKFVLHLAQQAQTAGHSVKVITYDGHHLSTPNTTQSFSSLLRECRSVTVLLHTLIHRIGRIARTFVPEHERFGKAIIQRTYNHGGVPVLAFAHQRQPQHILLQMEDRTLTAFAQRLLTQDRPDLIHVGHPMRMAEFLHVAQGLQIPYLITLTDYWMLCTRFFLITQTQGLCQGPRSGAECRCSCPKQNQKLVEQRYMLARQLCRQAKAVIAPSHFLANLIQKEFGPLSLQVIPYGITNSLLQLNQRIYPTDAPLIFLFAGRLKDEKGIKLLLAVFQQLRSPDIRLEIYGFGPLESEVRQAADEDQRICFGGVYTDNELGALLSRVDVVVIPSTWHENLPLIMQEAQAAGVPTLVSDVGGMTECVTDGVNGFTFRVGDVEDLQRKMQGIIDQPEVLNEIKENMRNPKSGQYRVTSLKEEASLYLAQYGQIVKKYNNVALNEKQTSQ